MSNVNFSAKTAILNNVLSPSKAVKLIQTDKEIGQAVKIMLTAQATVQTALSKKHIFGAVTGILFGTDNADPLSEVEVVIFLDSQLPESQRGKITGANILEKLLQVGKRTSIRKDEE